MEEINDTPEYDFIYQIDLSIQTGDVKYIINAIKKYKSILSQNYIDWANRIIIDLTQEAIDEMIIT